MSPAIASPHQFDANPAFWTATLIFIIAYVLIVSEKIHKTVVAICGAALMLTLPILDRHEAFHVEEFGLERHFSADRHDDDQQPDPAQRFF